MLKKSVKHTPPKTEEEIMGIKELCTKKSTLYSFPASVLNFYPGFNRRQVRENKQQLKNQILEEGKVNVPLSVFLEEGKLYVQSGNGRLECVLELIAEGHTIQDLPAYTVEKPQNDEQWAIAIARQVSDNDGEPLKPLELARIFADLRDTYGWNNHQIANKTGRTEALVGQYLRLLDQPEIVAVVEAGEISASLAVEIMKADTESAQAVIEAAIVAAKAEGKSKATPKHVKKPAVAPDPNRPEPTPRQPKELPPEPTPTKVKREILLQEMLEEILLDGFTKQDKQGNVTLTLNADLWKRAQTAIGNS